MYPISVTIALFSGNLTFHFSYLAIAALGAQAIIIGSFLVVPYRISKHVDATQYIIINNIYTPVTVLVGVFLLHEAFTTKQVLATAFLIIGAILVAVKRFGPQMWRLDSHSWELIYLSVLFGVGLAAEKVALGYMSVFTYIIVGWGLQFIVTALWSYKHWRVIPTIKQEEWLQIAKLGIVRCGHALGYIFALAWSANVSQIASITTFRVPLVFVASYFLLKERDHLPRRLVGVAIATFGLLLF